MSDPKACECCGAVGEELLGRGLVDYFGVWCVFCFRSCPAFEPCRLPSSTPEYRTRLNSVVAAFDAATS